MSSFASAAVAKAFSSIVSSSKEPAAQTAAETVSPDNTPAKGKQQVSFLDGLSKSLISQEELDGINADKPKYLTFEEYEEPHGYSVSSVREGADVGRVKKMKAIHKIEIAPVFQFQAYVVKDANQVSVKLYCFSPLSVRVDSRLSRDGQLYSPLETSFTKPDVIIDTLLGVWLQERLVVSMTFGSLRS